MLLRGLLEAGGAQGIAEPSPLAPDLDGLVEQLVSGLRQLAPLRRAGQPAAVEVGADPHGLAVLQLPDVREWQLELPAPQHSGGDPAVAGLDQLVHCMATGRKRPAGGLGPGRAPAIRLDPLSHENPTAQSQTCFRRHDRHTIADVLLG